MQLGRLGLRCFFAVPTSNVAAPTNVVVHIAIILTATIPVTVAIVKGSLVPSWSPIALAVPPSKVIDLVRSAWPA